MRRIESTKKQVRRFSDLDVDLFFSDLSTTSPRTRSCLQR